MGRVVELTPRQREILRRVVEEYVSTGEPVGSKTLVERSAMRVSSSTVRNELAALEERGLLMHPHTSAGRIPTETGYRVFADDLRYSEPVEYARWRARGLGSRLLELLAAPLADLM